MKTLTNAILATTATATVLTGGYFYMQPLANHSDTQTVTDPATLPSPSDTPSSVTVTTPSPTPDASQVGTTPQTPTTTVVAAPTPSPTLVSQNARYTATQTDPGYTFDWYCDRTWSDGSQTTLYGGQSNEPNNTTGKPKRIINCPAP